MNMTPEQQIEVIKARAEGKQIEYRVPNTTRWLTSTSDFDFRSLEYRVTKKPDIVVERYAAFQSPCYGHLSMLGAVNCLGDVILSDRFDIENNLKLTFDGETGELKSAEVI